MSHTQKKSKSKLPRRRRPADAPSPMKDAGKKASANDYRKLQDYSQLLKKGDMEAASAMLQRFRDGGLSDQAIAEADMLMAEVTQDWGRLAEAALRALVFKPDDGLLIQRLLEADLRSGRVICVRQTLSDCQRRGIEMVFQAGGDASEINAEMQKEIDRRLKENDLEGPAGIRLLADHERSVMMMSISKFGAVIRQCQKILQANSEFTPAWNNLSMAAFLHGNYDQAIAAADQSIQLKPNRPYSLIWRERLRFLSGHDVDYERDLQHFVDQPPFEERDAMGMLFETLALLGRDEEVVRISESPGWLEDEPLQENVTCHHVYAYSLARLGRVGEAIDEWEDCGHPMAAENLDDLTEQVGHAPFAIGMSQWMSKAMIDRMIHSKDKNTKKIFTALLPHLLDRCDAVGRELAMIFAKNNDDPASTKSLQEFASGKRGPGSMRSQAYQHLQAGGHLPAGSVQLWDGKNYREVEMLSTEIVDEPSEFPQPINDLYEAAQFARSEDDLDEAERLYREALTLCPGEPSFRYNLLEISLVRGDKDAWPKAIEESEAILRDAPDYVFAHILLARHAIELDDIEKARDHITPFTKRPKLSFAEAVALYACHGELALAQDEIKPAEASLNMLRSIDAGDLPLTKQLESKIARAKRTKQTLVV